MRYGIIISVSIVLLFVLFFIASSIHNPDPPTDATAPARLVKVNPPDNLPKLYTPDDPSGNAAEAYKAVLAFYRPNSVKLADDSPPTAVVEKLIGKLIDAMNAGHVEPGFMDDQIPLKPGAIPAYEDAMEVIPRCVLARAQKVWDNGDEVRAIDSVRSIFALGERLWFNSVRLYNRRQGLQMMVNALTMLTDWQDHADSFREASDSAANKDTSVTPAQKIDVWVKFVKAIISNWDPKVKLVSSIRPEVGDLLNIASNDQDRSFRIEAVLQIGVRKFNPENKGNEIAMHALLEKLQRDSDDMIAQAAKVADEFTEAEMKRLN